MDNSIDDIIAHIGDITSKKMDRSVVLSTLFEMRNVFESRAKEYGEPSGFLRDMMSALTILNDPLVSANGHSPDAGRGFFITMLTLKLLRFANNPYGSNGKECMLDLANYAVLCLTVICREENQKLCFDSKLDQDTQEK